MLMLAVDTSGKNGSVALMQFQGAQWHLLELTSLEGGTFSAQLIPQISTLLAKHNLAKHDIGGFAVVSGPGSFTGLRVGLAAIKALAEAWRKPIAAVSLLEAMARAAGIKGNVLAVIDAGRGNIYCGEYVVHDSGANLIKQQVLSGEELVNREAARPLVTFDSGIAERTRQKNWTVIKIDYPRADSVARIGFQKLQAGEVISPEGLDADYISSSGAVLGDVNFRKLK